MNLILEASTIFGQFGIGACFSCGWLCSDRDKKYGIRQFTQDIEDANRCKEFRSSCNAIYRLFLRDGGNGLGA
jgi:hypothetical protein